MITQYKTLTAKTEAEMDKLVTSMIADGWQPYHSQNMIYFSNGVFHITQAMVKWNDSGNQTAQRSFDFVSRNTKAVKVFSPGAFRGGYFNC